jgi:type IV pilus assembly protein PilA
MEAMKNNKGFTLLELMIIVAILGILVALIIPFFDGTSAHNAAKTDTCNPSWQSCQR